MSSSNKQFSATAAAIQRSLQSILDSGSWRAYDGECSSQLKAWIASALRVEFVRLCCSGTFAVELALRGLKFRPEDEIILSAYDFPGNFRCVEDAGAKVVLCDPLPEDGWVVTPRGLDSVVTPACKGLIVSHLHGQLAPMRKIMEWARETGVKVVEDACQAHGAIVDGKPVGSWGDVGVFSYGGSKLISAGRGGVVVTNDPLVAQRMTVFCERGNNAFPFSEIQSALVLAQYGELEREHAFRLQMANSMVEKLSKFDWLQIPFDVTQNSPAFYKLGMLVGHLGQGDVRSFERLRSRVLAELTARGIEAGEGFRGFADRSPKRYRVPSALTQCRQLAARTLVLHHSSLLNPQHGTSSIELVLDAIQKIDQELML